MARDDRAPRISIAISADVGLWTFLRAFALGGAAVVALAVVFIASRASGTDAASRLQLDREHQRQDRYRAMLVERHVNTIAYQLRNGARNATALSRSRHRSPEATRLHRVPHLSPPR
jgi:hypothetical protein